MSARPTWRPARRAPPARPRCRKRSERRRWPAPAIRCAGHGAQLSRAPEVHADRSDEHQHRPQRMVQLHRAVEDALSRLPDDPRAGDGHEACLAEGREVLNFAVAVGVIFVRGLVADTDGEEGQRRTDQIEARVRRVGKHAQRTRKQAGCELQQRHDRRGQPWSARPRGAFPPRRPREPGRVARLPANWRRRRSSGF